MPWNPDVDLQFKNIRFQPFFDLAEFISGENLKTAVDLGCGTGEQTLILAQKFPQTQFLGTDESAEMLEKSKAFVSQNLNFENRSFQEFVKAGKKYDLIFSNAALQWENHHEELFPNLISLLNENGQFAVQMPMQNDNILNQILLNLVEEEPFSTYLKGFVRESPVLTIDDYAQILFENNLQNLQILQKVYPIIADDVKTLFDFISGSTMVPYMERLDENQQQEFSVLFKKRIAERFTKFPAIYAFKRLLLYGRKD